MPNSPRMSWPYPAENAEQWYVAFENFVNSMDTSGFAARDDRHLVITGGGDVTWTLSSNTLQWTSDISIVSAITGFKITIEATSVTLTDGQLLYAVLTRAPTQNITATTVGTGTQVPNTDNALLLAVRVGDNIYWRNGLMLLDGVGVVNLGASQGGGGGGEVVAAMNQVVTMGATAVEIDIGTFAYDGSSNSAPVFEAVIEPDAAVTCELRLYDRGPVAGPATTAQLASKLTTSTAGLQTLNVTLTTTASPTFPDNDEIYDSGRMYVVRAYISGTLGDTLWVGKAAFTA